MLSRNLTVPECPEIVHREWCGGKSKGDLDAVLVLENGKGTAA